MHSPGAQGQHWLFRMDPFLLSALPTSSLFLLMPAGRGLALYQLREKEAGCWTAGFCLAKALHSTGNGQLEPSSQMHHRGTWLLGPLGHRSQPEWVMAAGYAHRAEAGKPGKARGSHELFTAQCHGAGESWAHSNMPWDGF